MNEPSDRQISASRVGAEYCLQQKNIRFPEHTVTPGGARQTVVSSFHTFRLGFDLRTKNTRVVSRRVYH